MPLSFYDSQTRDRRPFAPIFPSHVRMYVCGPTVYDRAHLGNARPVVVFDVLYRLLQRHYPHVTYVRNITDIDDKIVQRSLESGEPIADLTARTAEMFFDDMAELNALPPSYQPRATQNIQQMLSMIGALISRGHAYEAEGHVLFDVRSNPRHGLLSGNDLDGLRAGARVDPAPFKRDPADFVLWKPSPPGWPAWDSPWGPGRPGWHIECSAMARVYLGVEFDIHGGGHDLIFPHHENEQAQTTCAHGTERMAQWWMHNGMLTVDGKKMSKSAGNFLTVRDILAYGPWAGEAFRLLVLKTHYRSDLDYTRVGLLEARRELDGFYRVVGSAEAAEAVPEALDEALGDDLNTPLAVARLHEMAGRRDGPALLAAGRALGLFRFTAEEWFRGDGDASIEARIAARAEARARRDFREADAIRTALLDEGVVLEDGPQGTTWRRV